MKKVLVSDSIYVFLTNEEYKIYQMAKNNTIQRSNLSERQRYLTSSLYKKGVFSCKKHDGEVFYNINENGYI